MFSFALKVACELSILIYVCSCLIYVSCSNEKDVEMCWLMRLGAKLSTAVKEGLKNKQI